MSVKATKQGPELDDLALEHGERAFGVPAPTLGQLEGTLRAVRGRSPPSNEPVARLQSQTLNRGALFTAECRP